MPNHVDQDLTISGDSLVLRQFMKFAEEQKDGKLLLLSANKFLPYPEKYLELDRKHAEALAACQTHEEKLKVYSTSKDGFNSGGYEWCCDNWGTKWGIYDCRLVSSNLDDGTRRRKYKIEYNFQSAWSPADLTVLAMSKQFPSLVFDLKFYEGAMGFQGHLKCQGGVILVETQKKYRGHRGG
jgi:hypothetical protein